MTWTSIKNKISAWAESVLENVSISIENLPDTFSDEDGNMDTLEPDLFVNERRHGDPDVYVVGLEDNNDKWKDSADILIKIYERDEQNGEDVENFDAVRIEFYLSGVRDKEIKYRDETLIDYTGVSPIHFDDGSFDSFSKQDVRRSTIMIQESKENL